MMGAFVAKFRKEKSTQAILEGLQELINGLETFAANIQAKKKRIVGSFLAISVAVYVIAFSVFYFAYFPPTWKEKIIYCIPLLLFPVIIILISYFFTWYFQRKLNNNSKKLAVLKAEKKKILKQVLDKETYKVAVQLLTRFGDKTNKATPNTGRQLLNRSPTDRLRCRTDFYIVDQQKKYVFDRILSTLIDDGPIDQFVMICKDCYSKNGTTLRDDYEYTNFQCGFCNGLNPAGETPPEPDSISTGSDTSSSEDNSDNSRNEASMNANPTLYSTPTTNLAENIENENITAALLRSSLTSDTREENQDTSHKLLNEANKENLELKANSSIDEFMKKFEKLGCTAEVDPSINPE